MLSTDILNNAITRVVNQFNFFNNCDSILEFMAGIDASTAQMFNDEREALKEAISDVDHTICFSHHEAASTKDGRLFLGFAIHTAYASFRVMYRKQYTDTYVLDPKKPIDSNTAVKEFSNMLTAILERGYIADAAGNAENQGN